MLALLVKVQLQTHGKHGQRRHHAAYFLQTELNVLMEIKLENIHETRQQKSDKWRKKDDFFGNVKPVWISRGIQSGHDNSQGGKHDKGSRLIDNDGHLQSFFAIQGLDNWETQKRSVSKTSRQNQASRQFPGPSHSFSQQTKKQNRRYKTNPSDTYGKQ